MFLVYQMIIIIIIRVPDETKIIFYKDEDKVLYMIKLKDFQNALNLDTKCLRFCFSNHRV